VTPHKYEDLLFYLFKNTLSSDYKVKKYVLKEALIKSTSKKMTVFLGGYFSIEKEIKNFFLKKSEAEEIDLIKVYLTVENIDDEITKLGNYMKNPCIVFIYCNIATYNHMTKLTEMFNPTSEIFSNLKINDNFRIFVFTKDINKLLSQPVFDICTFLNRQNPSEIKNFKNAIIDDLEKIDEEVYNSFINKSRHLLVARKLFFTILITHNLLKQLYKYNKHIMNIPFDFNKRDLCHCLIFVDNYLKVLDESQNVILLLQTCLEIYYAGRLIYNEDYNRFIKIIFKFLDEDKFMNNKFFFYLNDHSKLNIPVKDISLFKEDLISIFENITSECYSELLDIVNPLIIQEEENKFQGKVFNLLSKISGKVVEEEEDPVIDYQKSLDIVEKIRRTLPEPIKIDVEFANPTFKVTKNGDYVNLTDESLKVEVNSYNKYLNKIIEELYHITNVLNNKATVDHFYLKSIQNIIDNILPEHWKNFSYQSDSDIIITSWLEDLDKKFKYLREWLLKSTPDVLEASYFFNFKYLLINLTLHYSRKFNISVEDIVLKFMPAKLDLDGNIIVTKNIERGEEGDSTVRVTKKTSDLKRKETLRDLESKKSKLGKEALDIFYFKGFKLIHALFKNEKIEVDNTIENICDFPLAITIEPLNQDDESEDTNSDNLLYVPIFDKGADSSEFDCSEALGYIKLKFDPSLKEEFLSSKGIKIFLDPN